MKPSFHWRSIQLPLVIALVSAISMILGMRLQDSLVHDGYITAQNDEELHLSAIYEATEHIRSKFYGDTLDTDFTDEVLDHMVDQLDPYSHYFKPEQDNQYNKYIKGLYAGIGIEFVELNDTIYNYFIVEGSPAHESNLQSGEKLLTVDSISFTDGGADLDSLIRLLNKSEGPMTFTVLSRNNDERRTVKLTSRDITLPLVEDYLISNNDEEISYVRLHRFYKSVYQDMMQALEKHKHSNGQSPNKLIIDVRRNPGGVVEETVKILNQLFDEKEITLLETRSHNGQPQVYKSNGRRFLDIERVVILCDEQSASASEILAGVLQDYDRAVVIGSHTFGKGLIQQNYDLANNGSINLSIGEYILPSGRRIYRNQPDSVFKSLNSERDLPRSEKGIAADIELGTCQITSADILTAKKLVIAKESWEPNLIRSSFTLSDHKNLWTGIDTSCEKQYLQNLKWQILEDALKEGDTLSYTDLDLHTQIAVDVISGQRYDEILGLNN